MSGDGGEGARADEGGHRKAHNVIRRLRGAVQWARLLEDSFDRRCFVKWCSGLTYDLNAFSGVSNNLRTYN